MNLLLTLTIKTEEAQPLNLGIHKAREHAKGRLRHLDNAADRSAVSKEYQDWFLRQKEVDSGAESDETLWIDHFLYW